jgi:hypothetical protein
MEQPFFLFLAELETLVRRERLREVGLTAGSVRSQPNVQLFHL